MHMAIAIAGLAPSRFPARELGAVSSLNVLIPPKASPSSSPVLSPNTSVPMMTGSARMVT
mgnify:CR=1 FL=1